MKHKENRATLALVIAAALSASAQAADDIIEPNQGWFIGGHVKHAEFDGERKDSSGNEIRRGSLAGLEFGFDISDKFAWRLSASDTKINSDGVNSDDSGMWYAADLLYHINDRRNYFIFGVDYIDLDSEATSAAHLGLGIRYNFTSAWVLTGEAAVHQGLDDSYTDFTVGLGLRYYFGEPAVKPQKQPEFVTYTRVEPKDTDQDGVVDSLDECPDTTAGYVVDRKGCTLYRQETVTKRLMVNFDNNSSVVGDDSKLDIRELAQFMEKYPQLNVVVEGHTSIVGSDDYNQMLSEKRANRVSEILVNDFGIDASRVSAKGYGETDLLLKGNSEKIHAANRRIMAVLSVNEKVGILK